MIPEEYQSEIIDAGISLMNAITRAYGTDEGMKLYDIIMSSVDPDIKGKIFFSLITGDHEQRKSVHIKGYYYAPAAGLLRGTPSKVMRIKAVREVSGIGLKEAKDMMDAVDMGKAQTVFVKSEMKRSEALRILRESGLEV